jgi:pyrimidine deaminase RibD-like protein
MNAQDRDRELMKLAVDLSRKSCAEKDGRSHPFVGAVIVHPNGTLLATGWRGKHTPGNHAEQEALVDLEEDVVAGSIVYSTLEPCSVRGTQSPCCLRLIDKRISEVVIGILDPNPDIRGDGWWKFEEQRIRVRNFDQEFVQQIRELNTDFIQDQLGPGIVITDVEPAAGSSLKLTPEQQHGHSVVNVWGNVGHQRLIVRGTYRRRPTGGHRLRLFVRRRNTYWPQDLIDFSFDTSNRIWQAPAVWVRGEVEPLDNEILVADLSEDLLVSTTHYNDVYDALHDNLREEYRRSGRTAWVGLRMECQPPGFLKRASIRVSAALCPQNS